MLYNLDMPLHKIEYVIRNLSLVEGLWGCLERYGITYSKENHELLIELVQDKLEGPDLEREWTEDEYNNFVLFKKE